MLQDIRGSMQSTGAKVVIGLVIATFALFGVESIVGGLGGEPEVATVNGEGITEREFLRAVETQRQYAYAQMGDAIDPDLIDENLLRSTTLERLIEDKVIVQDAQQKELYMSLGAINHIITQMSQFQRDGQFSNDVLDAFLRNRHYTLKDFQDDLFKQLIAGHARSAVIDSAFVLPGEVDEVLMLDRETRTFGLLNIDKNEYKESVEVEDSELLGYYEDNKDEFQRPRNVDVSYLLLDRDLISLDYEPSEEALEEAYQQEIEGFVGEEQRDASHILVQIGDERSAEEALSLIQDVATKLGEGGDFAELAKEFSEDEGSAGDGGALGMSAKGVYVQEFEDALFSLTEGQVSEPVKTEFGYHLIKLNSIQENSVPSLDEMRFNLVQRLIQERATDEFNEMTSRLEDLSYSASDLEEPAEALELEIKQLAGVSNLTKDPYFSNPKVQRRLFDPELVEEGNNSDVVTLDDGKALVFRVNALHEASIAPFDDVRDIVQSKVINSKATKVAEANGKAFIARVGAGEDPKLVAQDLKLDYGNHTDIRRNNVMVNSEVVQEVFAIAKSEERAQNLKGFTILDGDYAVVFLESVDHPDESGLSEAETKTISGMLSSGVGGGDYQSYRESMISSAIIERI